MMVSTALSHQRKDEVRNAGRQTDKRTNTPCSHWPWVAAWCSWPEMAKNFAATNIMATVWRQKQIKDTSSHCHHT